MLAHLAEDPIALALRLCELPEPRIGGRFLEELPAATSWLRQAGALREGPLLKGFLVDDDFEGLPCEVAWRPETSSYAYFSRTGRWVEVPPEHLRLWILDLSWLLRQIGQAVAIDARFQPLELVHGVLWDLGDTWVGKRKAAILFGRRMGDVANLDAVQDALVNRIGRPPGVLLTTSRRLSRHLTRLGGHGVLCIHDCLRPGSPGLHLDLAIVDGVVRGRRPADAASVQASANGGCVRVHDREFVFTGDIQRAIVRQLVEAWQAGRPRVRTQHVLEEAGSRAQQLRRAFGGHPNWQELIGYGQGFCWLKVD